MLFGRRQRRIKRILIVEDEPLVAFDNEHVLRDAGYEIGATVDTVPDAMAAMDAELDLVLERLDSIFSIIEGMPGAQRFKRRAEAALDTR